MNHLGGLLPILIIVITWVMGAKKAARAQKGRTAAPAADADERTRQVQEEIRRKIALRRGEEAAPPVAVARRPLPAERPPPPEVSDLEEVLAEQQKLVAEVRALDATRPAAPSRPAPLAVPVGAGATAVSLDWQQELRDPASVRRAIVLREILGRPKGLRA